MQIWVSLWFEECRTLQSTLVSDKDFNHKKVYELCNMVTITHTAVTSVVGVLEVFGVVLEAVKSPERMFPYHIEFNDIYSKSFPIIHFPFSSDSLST